MIDRCVNIDWLEVYCLESHIGYPHNADYYRRLGWGVWEREYGTPVYHEMFVLMGTDGQPLLEIRRNPKSAQGIQAGGVLDPMSCHIRLTNRTCYYNDCCDQLRNFLQQYGYGLSRISRIDLCLDFERFDYGDDPAEFLARYMKHRYSKINQADISTHGRDLWDGRIWNSLSWGSKKSMIGTKFYNKTMELAQKQDKPYIRRVWQEYHLVDDYYTLTKRDADGKEYTPQIWRVEFSIKSSTRNWFVIEDNNGEKRKIRSIRNTLDMYDTKQKQLDMFLSLADHYFHFKRYKDGVRKDRCPDKLLFRYNDRAQFYKLESLPTRDPRCKMYDRLLAKLIEYRDNHYSPDVYKACNVLIEQMQTDSMRNSLTYPIPSSELTLMRLLIAKRIKDNSRPLSLDLAETRALLDLYDTDIFGEVTTKK